ncbi:MAG: sterol desaturase/sphingolipid hydroxylase (fatty acid hydroxylase superfamily) [Candidatus Azotimanducaceae bacterium]|jgi:sterol desaturase/sphingolipid hydroxylase (fatty acid hydroxylase superfamily)
MRLGWARPTRSPQHENHCQRHRNAHNHAMDIDLDTGKLVVFIAGLLFFFSVETAFPKRPWQQSRLQRVLFHISVAALNTVIVRALIFVPLLLWLVYVEEQGWGISRWLGLVGWVEILASVVVLDLLDYFWHRANHRVNFLWRFHKAHHADTSMDVTTALRFHPCELIVSALAKAIWVAIWGPTAIAWFIFEGLISLCAQFHHTNIDFSDRIEQPLSRLIVTPRFHAAHHAVDRQYGDANFSTIFSCWDYLMRSYVRPADNGATTSGTNDLGLPEARDLAFSPLAWVMEPLSRRNLRLRSLPATEDK